MGRVQFWEIVSLIDVYFEGVYSEIDRDMETWEVVVIVIKKRV